MYPFMTLDDGTEIVHSETLPDGRVKVYMEKPDEKDGFHHAVCYLPDYQWEDIDGLSAAELERCKDVIESTAHLILRFAACAMGTVLLTHFVCAVANRFPWL